MVFPFQNGRFYLKDKPREGCPRRLDADVLEAAIGANQTITVSGSFKC